MPNITSRAVPTNYCWLWIESAAHLLKVNYPLILGVSFVLIGIAAAGLMMGTFGSPLASVISAFLSPGLLLIVHDFTNGEKSSFEKLSFVFRDSEVRSRLIPLVVFNFFSSLANGFLVQKSVAGGLILSALVLPFTYFSVPLITFHKMTFLESLSGSANAVIKNIKPLIIFAVLVFFLLLILGLLLFLPLIFFGLPLLMIVNYPVYASIFLNLDLKILNNGFKAKFKASSGN